MKKLFMMIIGIIVSVIDIGFLALYNAALISVLNKGVENSSVKGIVKIVGVDALLVVVLIVGIYLIIKSVKMKKAENK